MLGGAAWGRRRRGSLLFHWPKQLKLEATGKIAREPCSEAGHNDGECVRAREEERIRRAVFFFFSFIFI